MDAYQRITDSIIESIEQGVGEPVMPWHRGGAHAVPENIETGNQYRGVNIVSLWVSAQVKAYSSNVWGTYRQWKGSGAQVRKGEKASLIIFYKELPPKDDDEEEQEPIERIETAERYVKKTGAAVIEGGATACYRPATDTIHMPDEARFFDTKTSSRTESYYSVLFHELTHFSGHSSRLNRDLKNRFGSEAYAMEELVAELGAAFQCAKLGIATEPREDHARYIAHWLQVLKNDKKAIFAASARAQEATDFLLSLSQLHP